MLDRNVVVPVFHTCRTFSLPPRSDSRLNSLLDLEYNKAILSERGRGNPVGQIATYSSSSFAF